VKRLVLGLLLLSLALAGGLSYLASETPDGLEKSLARHDVAEGESVVAAPMADYQSPWGGQWLAGVSGTLAVFGLTLVVGWGLARKKGAS
jgi:hypothetical protein